MQTSQVPTPDTDTDTRLEDLYEFRQLCIGIERHSLHSEVIQLMQENADIYKELLQRAWHENRTTIEGVVELAAHMHHEYLMKDQQESLDSAQL